MSVDQVDFKRSDSFVNPYNSFFVLWKYNLDDRRKQVLRYIRSIELESLLKRCSQLLQKDNDLHQVSSCSRNEFWLLYTNGNTNANTCEIIEHVRSNVRSKDLLG